MMPHNHGLLGTPLTRRPRGRTLGKEKYEDDHSRILLLLVPRHGIVLGWHELDRPHK